MNFHRVHVFHGSNDPIVDPAASDRIVDYYKYFLPSSSQVWKICKELLFPFKKISWGGPRCVMVALLTLKQEVRGSNPGAALPKFGAHTPSYYPTSRSQRCVKGP